MNALTALSSEALTTRIHELVRTERITLVDFLRHLAELERRKLHIDLGHSSVFAYCTDELGLSEASAYRRMTAARLIVRFPSACDYLADGRLKLTTLVLMRDVLNEENFHDLFERASKRTE